MCSGTHVPPAVVQASLISASSLQLPEGSIDCCIELLSIAADLVHEYVDIMSMLDNATVLVHLCPMLANEFKRVMYVPPMTGSDTCEKNDMIETKLMFETTEEMLERMQTDT